MINHDILLRKLEHCGIRGIAKNWISNYLTNRKQYVDFEGERSDLCDILYGVPQGSILGPLLYLIYVNDIGKSSNGCILSFADDTSLIISDRNLIELFLTANAEMNKLYEWFCANRLSLNANKTKFIILKSPHQKCDYSNLSIKLDGIKLCQIGKDFKESSVKFLGVHVDEHLTWKYHLNHINTKISRAMFMMKKVKHFLPTDTMTTLYHAMIQPHLNYGILAWGSANQKDLNRSNILQKKAIRIVHKKAYNSHTDPLFRRSNILKVSDLYKYESLLFMQAYTQQMLPSSFSNIFKRNHECRENIHTRQNNLFRIDRCDSAFASRLPLYHLPRVWNSWPTNLSLMSTRKAKFNIRKCLIDSYAETVNCANPACRDCAI